MILVETNITTSEIFVLLCVFVFEVNEFTGRVFLKFRDSLSILVSGSDVYVSEAERRG